MFFVWSEVLVMLASANINQLFMAYKVLGLLLTHYIGCCSQCKMMWLQAQLADLLHQ